ncbi:MAG TPA: YtxH domain-containing protein [Tepidisphaeraceae bacterium]|jgi:hypothetical protein|nr:YtxH domain-containing protein [Tepidisphaeraceae bacterium]
MTRYRNSNQRRRSSGTGIVTAGLTVLGGLAIGAGVMYLLDPEKGSSRRRYIRDTAGNALASAGDLAASLRTQAADLPGSAEKLLQQSREMIQGYTQEKEKGLCATQMAALVLGGGVLAALAYVVTTEFSSIRRGDLKGAASHAYQHAADAASSVRDSAAQMAGRAGEFFKDQPEQPDSAGA